MGFTYALLVLTACLAGCCLYSLFLGGRRLWRRRTALAPRSGSEIYSHKPNTGFNSRTVAQEIIRVRSDYLKALHSRPHPLSHPEAFVSAARRALAASGYFRNRLPHDDPSDETHIEGKV